MRRVIVIGRIRKLALALLACLVFAVLAPLYFSDRRLDEPFAVSSVVASPRDMHILSAPVRLGEAPNLTLHRGTAYAYGPNGAERGNSSLVLDGPVFTLNAGSRGALVDVGGSLADPRLAPSPLIEQIANLGFDLISIRRGTLNITGSDGIVLETITDIQAEVTGRRKGQVAGRGTFVLRGQRVTFDATIGQSADKRSPLRWPLKANLKGGLLEASFDGSMDVADDLQLAGALELTTPSLRRIGRWFGLPLHTSEGFNAASIKAQLNWARQLLAFEKAKVTVDGNEAHGRLALNVAGERPLIDATLDFAALNVTPYVEAARVPFFGIDIPSTTWSSFDLSLPMIRHIDADLRISARKLAFRNYAFGQAGATITAQAGKLQADLTELDLNVGTATAQVTAIMTEAMPRYALRGKVENIDAGAATALWLGQPAVSGRATLTTDVTSTGYSPTEVIKRLSGKSSLSVVDGRMAIDLAAFRSAAKTAAPPSWAGLLKSQVPIDQLEARALIIDGVAFSDAITARSGSLGLGASGRFGLTDGNMELRFVAKANVPNGRPLQMSDMLGGEAFVLRGPWREPTIRLDDDQSRKAGAGEGGQ
jgi:hypothetical protein